MYLILTGFYDDGQEFTASVNMGQVSYVTDLGDRGCKLKFTAGSSLGAIQVRQSFADVNAALNPVAVYTQKEQPK